MVLLKHLISAAGATPSERVAIAIGRLTARLHALRRLSLSVATKLQRGENPALEAALVKDVGAVFEQDIPEIAHDLFGLETSPVPDDACSAFRRISRKSRRRFRCAAVRARFCAGSLRAVWG